MAEPKITPPIHKNRNATMSRINNFRQTGGLYQNTSFANKLYGERSTTEFLRHFPILGEHGEWKKYKFEDIKNGIWVDVPGGQSFGPTWTTHWFHVKINKPDASWNGKEVHFRWGSGCEACLYDVDGNVLQGFSPGFREEFIVTKSWTGNEPLEYYVEMAANGMFGEGSGDLIAPPNPNRTFSIGFAEFKIFNRDVFDLLNDFEMLYGIAEQLSNAHIGYQAMFVANEMVNLLIEDSPENRVQAATIATKFFSEGTGEKAHTLYAMGHCHIDSAWLWPYDETIRKCARSFSAQLRLMDEYPEYKFVCSSAQQYEWVRLWYPTLFAKIKEQVVKGNFVPVGGTWIEMDGNLPSGEGFMRQYYYGQKFFEEELGAEYRSKEFWLPDTFGYSAQIPQMLKHVGITRFLTQKMSWNSVNQFPNHNFWWEGIDGTEVLVHFPPGNSYNFNGTVNEFLNSQNNSLDKGRANSGVFLYGYGDGGGGPTRQMIERIKRVQNVDGLPRVEFSESNAFFDELEKDKSKFYRWVGELYLELHNGTYTSQARIKWYNRKSEFLLREVELLLAMGYALGKANEQVIGEDMGKVDTCWKDVLLNQFHDVLPGSCIEFAAQDAWKLYEDVFNILMPLRKKYHELIVGGGTANNKAVFNALPWTAKTVIFMKPDGEAPPTGPNIQSVTLDATEFEDEIEGRFRVPSKFSAALVNLQPSGYTEFVAQAPANAVSFTAGSGAVYGTFTNGLITLEVGFVNGKPTEKLSLIDGPNLIPAFNDDLNKSINVDPGMFYIYDDKPNYWDAWDINDFHLETRRTPDFKDMPPTLDRFANGPIVGGYKWSATFGNGSTIVRHTIMRAESPMLEYYTVIDWKEDHKLLKVEFPVDVLSREATFEIQYGHAQRPTHINTSWDMAKYEVCGHKWMDISQADKGVTIITDSKYGWHVRDNHVCLSLLKSPKNPDANCDMQKHYIYYAVLPHKGTFQEAGVIQRAYELNLLGSNNVPLIPTALSQASLPTNFVITSHPSVVVEAVKVSKSKSSEINTICIRLYESHGGYADTDINFAFGIKKVFESNGLEDVGAEITPTGNKFSVRFKPFQIQSFLVTF